MCSTFITKARVFIALLFTGASVVQADLIQHLDATVSGSAIGNPITLWADQSGNGNHAVPAVGNVYYPSTSLSISGLSGVDMGVIQNSLRLLDATATDNLLNFAKGGGAVGNSGFAVLVAFKVDVIPNTWNDLIGVTSFIGQGGWGMRYGANGIIQSYLGGITIQKNGQAVVAAGDTIVYGFNYNAGTGSYDFWDSKNNNSWRGTIAAEDFTEAGNVMTLGSMNAAARYMQGMIGEVKVYNRVLSAEDFAAEQQALVLKWTVDDFETDPPFPNPASFELAPIAVSGTLISMTATIGSDVHGPVEYLFTETSGNPGGTSSVWQTDPIYRDGDLNPLTQYTYTVTMRDAYGNVGKTSSVATVTTLEASPPGQVNDLEYGAYYGYQGWHYAPGDGRIESNWLHWFENNIPDAAHVHGDMWPDLREYDPNHLYATQMQYPNGETAKLYSAFDYSTIDLHVKWMKGYGIKGCVVQRFTSILDRSDKLERDDKKVRDVMVACEKYGVKFWIMHDSGQGDENEVSRITHDWKHLVDDLDILQSPSYAWQNGLPAYGLWGVGINTRMWTPRQAQQILDFYQSGDPQYQAYVCGGVPINWRSNPPAGWSSVFDRLDMISPWRTIFYNTHNLEVMYADFNYCNDKGIDYNPVVSPGASTMHLRDSVEMRNWKPRNGGTFFWKQVYEVCRMGSKFMYVAMFDEVDEGTAMYKLAETSTDLPVGADQVALDEDGYDLPSDWYLRLGTEAQKMLEQSIPLISDIPIKPHPTRGFGSYR